MDGLIDRIDFTVDFANNVWLCSTYDIYIYYLYIYQIYHRFMVNVGKHALHPYMDHLGKKIPTHIFQGSQ